MPLYNIPAEQSGGEKIASIVSRLFGGYIKGQDEARAESRESQLFPAQLANLEARTQASQRSGQPKARTLQDVNKELKDLADVLKKSADPAGKSTLDQGVQAMLQEQMKRLYGEQAGFLGGQYQPPQPSQPATDKRWWRFDPDTPGTPGRFQPFGEAPTPSPAPAPETDFLGGATEPLAEKATGSLAEVAGGLQTPKVDSGVMKRIMAILSKIGGVGVPGQRQARKRVDTDASKRAELKRRGWTDKQIDAALRGN